MDMKINYISVVLSAISIMAVGAFWYSPVAFGKKWANVVGLSDAQLKEVNPKALIITAVGALVKAYFLAMTIYAFHHFYGHSFLHDALGTAFMVWLGFQLTATTVRNSFERVSNTHTLISVGGDLVSYLAMGLIIGLIGI